MRAPPPPPPPLAEEKDISSIMRARARADGFEPGESQHVSELSSRDIGGGEFFLSVGSMGFDIVVCSNLECSGEGLVFCDDMSVVLDRF